MSRAREAARLIGNNTFTIDSNNNVGLGSTLPGTKFELSGNSRLAGVITATEFDISGSTNTLTSGGLSVGVGTITTSFNVGTALTAGTAVVGSAVTINRTGLNVTGVITATSFVGSGSNLTGLPAGYTELDGMLFQ